ncbi:MAG: fibronectin type III domain-containing protein, partial [Cytophagales bacterium]|nr:fibronectin type III domain-containing protein [Cytophagales bacterium]
MPFEAQAQTFKAVPLDGGGWTSGFAQADNGRIYAYGDVFGAWRTDDGGLNWTYLNWNIPDGDIVGMGMAVQKDNADVVYYSTNNALYKSTNGGTTWTKLLGDIGHNTPRFRGSSPILVRANNPNEIWFAGPRKDLTGWLWKSSDGGSTWTKAGGSNFDSNRARTLHNISAYANQIWVGTDNGLYVSTDGGNTFAQVSNHGEVGMIQRFTTGPNAGAGLITRTQVNFDGGGVSRITATDYNNTSTYTSTRSNTVSLYFGYPTGLQIFSDNTACAWNTQGDRQGYSTDGGVTFEVRPTTLNTTHVPIWTTAAIMTAKNHPDYGTDQVIQKGNDPNQWIITGGGAAMQSFDKGLSWSYFPNGSGIAAVKAYVVGVSRHDVNRIYIPASDIGSAIVTDGGASGQATRSSCKSMNFLHGSFRIMEGPDANNLVIAGINQAQDRNILLKSGDGGANWTEANLASSGLPASTDGIIKSVMSLNNTNDFLVVLSEIGSPAQRVYRTTNGGASFNSVGLPDNMPTGGRYSPQNCFIERDATQANVRYFVARGNSFFKSTDGGSNWTAATHPFGNAWVWGMVADPVRSGNLWAAGDYAGVKYTTDGGNNWTSTATYFNARHVSSCDGKVAIWGTKDGESAARLWYSADNGVSWTAQTTFARNFHGVQGLTVDRNGKIWVSWNSCTVVTPVTSTVADTQAPTVPGGLASSNVTSTGFTLSWTASTDNVGVTGYEIFRNGTSIGTSTSTSYSVTGLTASTAYSMTVRARDAAGNNSAQSNALSVTTSAASGSFPIITARGENQPNEGKEKAFDGNNNSKWLDFSATSWLQIQYQNAAT